MDDRSNYKPTTIHRDPPALPWRKLLLGSALALGLAFAGGYGAHALLDWLDIPHAELAE